MMPMVISLKLDRHYICAFVSIVLWSTSSLAIMALNTVWTGLQIVAFAFLFASVFLFFIAWEKGKLEEIKTYKVKDFVIIFSVGSLGVFAYNILNTYSYVFATGTEAAAINYLWPIWIVVFSTIILKEKITLRKIMATLLSFFGMLLVVTRGDFSSFANVNIFGVSQAVLCSIFYGLFSVITKRVKYDKIIASMLYFLSSTIISFVCLFAFSSLPHFTLQISLWLILRGVGQFGIAYTAWTMALMGDTVKISNLALVTPFLQLTTIAIFMGEEIGLFPILGLVCIVGGTLIARMASES